MLDEIKKFVDEKKIKLDIMIKKFYKLPEFEMVKDIAILNDMFIQARHWLNESVQIYRDITMLEGLVKKYQTDLNYLVEESNITFLSDPEWLEKKNAKKLAKEERYLLAKMEDKDLYNSCKILEKFFCEVTALKRAAANKKEDLERVRKDLATLIWGIRTEEFFKGGVTQENAKKVQEYLTSGSAEMDSYLDPSNHT